MKIHSKLLLLTLVALAFSSCAPLTKPEQPRHPDLVAIESGGSLGQTFVARYDGLESITLFLEPGSSSQGDLVLHLRSGPGESTDIRTSSLPLQEVNSPGFYHFQFSPIASSNQAYYYAFISLQGSGSLQAGAAKGDAYLNGALYLDHEPQDAQAAFLLGYDRSLALLGLAQEGLVWLAWLLVSLFLYVIPGWALLCSLWPGWSDLHWAEKLGLAGGVSLALYPVLLLWTDLVGLRLGALYAWLPPLVGLGAIAWRSRASLSTLPGKLRSRNIPITFSLSTIPWPDLALLFTIALIFAVRFWVIRDLDYPMWGDSYQHTMIAQLIVDNGGLFDSWQPYAELTTFTYHFGFHAQAAAFHWITKLPMHQAILWVGQILNGLAAIFLFPLALRLNRNPWCGVIAVLIAGLLVPMPMFYVNWGRYTQLAGQAILPAAIYLSWAILEAKSTNWRALIPAWVALGGLALTHYRVLIFAVIFFAVFALLQFRTLGLRRVIVRTFWLGLGAGLLFLPWFVHVFAGRLMNILRHQVTTFPAPAASSTARGRNSSPDLSQYLPPLLWLALPVIIAWGLWRRHKGFAIISLWWYVVYLAANPQWFNLPGANAIGNLTVLIAAYFPISIMIGAEACWLIEDLAECSPISNITRKLQLDRLVIPSIILCLLIAGFGLWGMNQRRKEPSPEKYALATRSDSIAFDWLRQNTDNDARFLVNAIFHPTLGSAGSDGGWWLPLLANRQTTLPPSPYTSEQGPTSNYIVWIDELTKQILAEGINHPRTITMLRDRNITHVYIGQKQGSINTKAATIRPDELLVSPYFFPIYHQDRVWIFEFEP